MESNNHNDLLQKAMSRQDDRRRDELAALKPTPAWVPFDIERFKAMQGDWKGKVKYRNGAEPEGVVISETTFDGQRVISVRNGKCLRHWDNGGFRLIRAINDPDDLLMLAEPKQGKVLEVAIFNAYDNLTSFAVGNAYPVGFLTNLALGWTKGTVTLPPEDTK